VPISIICDTNKRQKVDNNANICLNIVQEKGIYMEKEIENLKKLKQNLENLKPSQAMVWQKYQSEEAKNIVFPKTTAYNLVYEENKNRKDNVAFGYGDSEISYGEFFDKVEQIIDTLKTKVKPGEVFSVASLHTPELYYLFYALGELHAITNIIDPRTSYEGILHYLSEVGSTKLLLLNIFNDKLKNICRDSNIEDIVNVSLRDSATKLPFDQSLISYITDFNTKMKYNDDHHYNFENYIKIKGNVNNDTYDYSYRENLPLTIVHTGGTTGVPKGVLLSHDTFNAMAWQYKYSGLDLQPNHRFMNMMPPFIAYGSDMVHMPLVMGMRADLVPMFNPEKFDKLIDKYKPNHFAGVPNHFASISNSKTLRDKDLSYIITAAAGGDGMSAQNHKINTEFLMAHGAKNGVSPGYAMTEVNSIFSVCVQDHFKYGSVGFPLPGATIGIFDENDNELNYNEQGQICLLTPTKMLGYYNNNEATREVLKTHADGKVWVHTGDLGYIDEDGYIWVSGRIKNMIIRPDGFKVFPGKIEKVVYSHPAVDVCKVVGIRNHDFAQGQKPKVYITLKSEYFDQEKKILNEISNLCKTSLAEYEIPYDFEVRKDFPLTPIGKIDGIALQKEDEEKFEINSNRKLILKR
jgi:long-chain acyl-CoA synthetase